MKKGLKVFTILIIIYSVGMALAFSLPNEYIEKNVNSSIVILDNEGLYFRLNSSDAKATKLDNFTDRQMIRRTIGIDKNPIISAMSMTNYARYWHGYQIFLRPLLFLVNYAVIRQLYGFILILLLGINFYLLIKKLDIFIALSLFISLYFARFYTFFLSMQFTNVFFLALIFNVFLLTRKEININSSSFLLYFFVIGSLTNFFDLLTVPLITLGIPLVILAYYSLKNSYFKQVSLLKSIINIVLISLSWGLGYALTWVSKWIIGTLILKQNVLKDAFNTVLFRTEGNEKYPLDRVNMFHLNLTTMFNKFNISLLVLFILLTIYIIIIKRKELLNKINMNSIIIIPIISFPYIWYGVLANHSQIHYWFTYRLQIISVFALLAFLSYIASSLLLNDKIED
ncbi:hypothetical protein P7D38_03455 [Enterococcus dongliensis]|uniref:hypothetical protein n=1 Tax=Enterococcus dongliensis TaxID=2559925 RepID=UPI002891B8BD|nr:hypothetical protein [Enterococcus dongliensis]MDT2644468.1 hypothetical protein [Enterococcus dongliensis]